MLHPLPVDQFFFVPVFVSRLEIVPEELSHIYSCGRLIVSPVADGAERKSIALYTKSALTSCDVVCVRPCDYIRCRSSAEYAAGPAIDAVTLRYCVLRLPIEVSCFCIFSHCHAPIRDAISSSDLTSISKALQSCSRLSISCAIWVVVYVELP